MKQTIDFHLRELADLYALRTLGDYMAPHADFDIVFTGYVDTDRAKKWLEGRTRREDEPDPTNRAVACRSDLSETARHSTLRLDIGVLKNCVVPMTAEEKRALRDQYGVPSDRPVLVIGNASPGALLNQYINATKDIAEVYVVGSRTSIADPNVHGIFEFGVLRDYYALADAAVNQKETYPVNLMNNFVEATEGGVLFHVAPKEKQFGYDALVACGAIRDYANADVLLENLVAYLARGAPHATVSSERAAHLLRTRQEYLPLFEQAVIDFVHGKPVAEPGHGLRTIRGPLTTVVLHDQSYWEEMCTQDIVTKRQALAHLLRELNITVKGLGRTAYGLAKELVA